MEKEEIYLTADFVLENLRIVNFGRASNLEAMTTTALRKELHKAIDTIDDEAFLKAMYTIVNEKTTQFDLSSEEWKEIELIANRNPNRNPPNTKPS